MKMFKKSYRKTLSIMLVIAMLFSFLPAKLQVKAAQSVKVSIDGYQINTKINAHRTVYSVETEGEIAEAGLIYGLKAYINDSDMVINSNNPIVHSYKATEEGFLSKSGNVTKYVMNMRFIFKETYFASEICERPYVKLRDGSYAYGDIVNKSVYNIADELYQNSEMKTETEHKYLYNEILKKTNASYEECEFNPVEETTMVPETTTKTPETTTKAPETTTKIPETTTKAPETTTEEEIITENLPKNIDLTSYFAGVDEASSSNTGDAGHKISDMFDGNRNTKYFGNVACPTHLAWKMSRAVVVKKYSITTGDDSAVYTTRNPLAWQLYGSNDATSWTQIDIVKENGTQDVNFGVYTYETDIQEPYQYYQIQIEKNDENYNYYGIQIAELTLYGDVAEATEKIGGSLDYFDSIYSSANTINGFNSEVPANLFDGNINTKMFNNGTGTIAWKTSRETTLYSYTLTTANDNETYTGRNPKSWILYGSTDGQNWTKIDTVKNSNMEDKNFTPYTFTVDSVGSYNYYKMDISALYGNSFQLSEISMNGCAVSPSEYDIMFTGDWDMIVSKNYVKELVKLFYNSYPRLYKRWGTGTEPKTITFKADSTYDGVAYCQGTTVCVSTTYANANPSDIGFFSHEITHSVQQYGGKLNYGGDLYWWTENMANYGGFRYFHWSNPNYVQVYQASDTGLQDWGYQPYGNNKWFFAYMDYRYPTTIDANGNKKLGLIDSINKFIKDNNTGSEYSDNPYTVGSPFNNVVREITGYNCVEDLRKHYVEELQNGTWAFTGFGIYTDNWLTENIDGIANPDYPMVKGKTHGNSTAPQIANVTSGDNLLSGASLVSVSGFTNANESGEKLFDNNLSTKWCATSSNDGFGAFALEGAMHWIKIDLGSQKTFNTYTIFNTSSAEYGYGNMSEWELLISNDGENWTSADYQVNKNDGISSFDIGTKSARYIALKVFNPGDSRGTIRLFEMQLYNR